MNWLLGFALLSPLLTLNVSTVQGSSIVVLAWLVLLWSEPKSTENRGLPLPVVPLLALWGLMAFDSIGVRDPWSASWWLFSWSSAALAGLFVWRKPKTLPVIQRWLAGLGVFLGSLNLMAFAAAGERSTVLFNNPNVLAGWLLGTAWCSLSLVRPWQRAVAFGIQVLGLACTGSRAALLSLVLTVAVYVIVAGGKWLRLTAPVLAVGLFLSPPVQNRIERLADDPTAFGRPAWWGIAMQLHRDEPGGLGTRQFGWHAMTYRPAFEGAPVYRYLKGAPGESAHSEWVQLLVDHGWGGPILLLLALALALRRGHGHMLAYGVLALALHALMDGTLQSEAVRVLWILFVVALCLQPGGRAIRLPSWTAVWALVLFSIPAVASLQPSLAAWVCRSGTASFQEARALPKGRAQTAQATQAAERFQWAARIDPRRARYPARLAALRSWQYEQGQVPRDAALEAQVQALELAPFRPHRLRKTADLYRDLGQHEDALKLRTRLVAIEPNQAVDRMERARALLALDRRPEALREMLVSLRLEPRYRRAWIDYGATLEEESEGAGRHAFARAASLAASFRAIYCDDPTRDCDRHRKSVMSRLEQRMAGDFIGEKDRLGVSPQ